MKLVTCLYSEGRLIVDEIWTLTEFYNGSMKRWARKHGLYMEIAHVIDGYYTTCIPTTYWLRLFQRKCRNLQN
jgi:hypothetical protein